MTVADVPNQTRQTGSALSGTSSAPYTATPIRSPWRSAITPQSGTAPIVDLAASAIPNMWVNDPWDPQFGLLQHEETPQNDYLQEFNEVKRTPKL